jgi:hypothetical protein
MSPFEHARPFAEVLITIFAVMVIVFSVIHQRFVSAMIRAINGHPGRSGNISSTLWYTGKFFLVQREYRKLFPSGADTARHAWAPFAPSAASAGILFALLISILPRRQ